MRALKLAVAAAGLLVALPAGASSLVNAGGPAVSLSGPATCPFVVRNAAGVAQGTIDCTGALTLTAGINVANGQFVGGPANTGFNFYQSDQIGASRRLTSNVSPGGDFFSFVNGQRAHFGSGASDYATSDGTTVTFAGPLAAASTITMGTLGNAIHLDPGGSQPIMGGPAGIRVGSNLLATTAGNKTLGTSSVPWGAAWVTGADIGSQKLTNVANGVAATDAATVGQVGHSSSPRTTVVNPALSVSAATCNAYGLTLTGAVVGAECVVGTGGVALGNLAVDCYVSAANTVQIHACNPTAGAISLPAATYSVRAWNP